MENNPFFIEFLHAGKTVLAEVKPCCNEEDIFYYDISINNQFQFSITPGLSMEDNNWKVALKNADKAADPQLVQAIGEHISQHFSIK